MLGEGQREHLKLNLKIKRKLRYFSKFMFLGNILDSEKNILSALGLNSGHSIM
jgi:cell division septal protein FtsQ